MCIVSTHFLCVTLITIRLKVFENVFVKLIELINQYYNLLEKFAEKCWINVDKIMPKVVKSRRAI